MTIILNLFLGIATAAQPAITIYNDNFAVVRDVVALDLEPGSNSVSYSGVTAQLEPESVILRDPERNVEISILEQSYRGDPIDQQGLLQLFEGQTIRFSRYLNNEEIMLSGKIVRAPTAVSVRNQYGHQQQKLLEPIIEVEGELRTVLPGQPLFPSLGDGSVLLPTLSWKLFSSQKAELEAQLSYLTYGMSWKADYNLVLPEKGDLVELTGWISIKNDSGKTFENARIKLMAGDVNKVKSVPQGVSRNKVYALAADAEFAAPQVVEKKIDEFHLYTLPLATTLRNLETKQVEFIRSEAVQTQRLFVYDGFKMDYYGGGLNTNQNYGQNSQPDVAIYREFINSEANGLGIPLPAGRLRFYRMDDDGQLEFTGENTCNHTPKNEIIRVYLGNAFDLVGERKRADFFRHPSRELIRESFAVEIRNRSEETVTVQVVEHLYRWSNWEIKESSSPFVKKDAQTIEFPITVEPDKAQTVTYTVEYTW